jgi:hypothetical protein
MTSVLVSGAEQQVRPLAEALRARHVDVTAVVDLADLPSVCAHAGPSAFDAYVQLSSTFEMRGETVVDRVHRFYADGVLARFPALSAALPTLVPDASLTFVLGHLPAEVASRDDRDARLSLTKVLSHAARADAPGSTLAIRVLQSDATLEELVAAALGEVSSSRQLVEGLADLDYADWRVEVLGLAALDT